MCGTLVRPVPNAKQTWTAVLTLRGYALTIWAIALYIGRGGIWTHTSQVKSLVHYHYATRPKKTETLGLEPRTRGLTVHCSNRLSYVSKFRRSETRTHTAFAQTLSRRRSIGQLDLSFYKVSIRFELMGLPTARLASESNKPLCQLTIHEQ